MSARLWVTGIGLVTPLGVGADQTWAHLVRGDRAMRTVRLFDATGQRASVVGEVADVSFPTAGRSVPAGWSRTSAMASAAAAEAMRGAHLDRRSARIGLVVGGTTGGMFENEQLLARLHAEPASGESLVKMLSHPLSVVGDCLDELLGPFARVRTVASACSSGANAIVVAASWLLAGDVDVVVAGGSDALCRLTLTGFNAIGALDPDPCRPFERRRRGTNLGEGSAFLVMERALDARARAAEPIAELAGWSVGAEAHHITNPAPDGAVVASLIERAIRRAGLTPEDIDYVNAHGTGTQLNDAMEAAALKRALGREIGRVAVSSSKGQIGHTLGAAGAIEAAITALVIARRALVPTAGLEQPDPTLALVHVPHVGKEVPRVRAALSNAFGFGGMDTVLVFTEPGFDSRTAVRPSLPEPLESAVITGAAVFGVCGLLGSAACAILAEQPFLADGQVDPDAHLDAARARRLDWSARLATVAVQHALAESGAPTEGAGVLLGSAYGNVDGSAAFMHRIFEKGPRAASPAEFPNMVPSSPVGHVSIYLELRGPTFTTADLATSGESAFVQATQLVAAREASCIVATAVEPKSKIVEGVLSGLFAHTSSQKGTTRSDLAAAVVVQSERDAHERGQRVLAHVHQVLEWRLDRTMALASLLPPKTSRAEAILPRPDAGADDLLGETTWRACPRLTCATAVGESDALGMVALAVAVGRIATGRVDEALVLGVSKGRGYAVVLAR